VQLLNSSYFHWNTLMLFLDIYLGMHHLQWFWFFHWRYCILTLLYLLHLINYCCWLLNLRYISLNLTFFLWLSLLFGFWIFLFRFFCRLLFLLFSWNYNLLILLSLWLFLSLWFFNPIGLLFFVSLLFWLFIFLNLRLYIPFFFLYLVLYL